MSNHLELLSEYRAFMRNAIADYLMSEPADAVPGFITYERLVGIAYGCDYADEIGFIGAINEIDRIWNEDLHRGVKIEKNVKTESVAEVSAYANPYAMQEKAVVIIIEYVQKYMDAHGLTWRNDLPSDEKIMTELAWGTWCDVHAMNFWNALSVQDALAAIAYWNEACRLTWSREPEN